MSILVNSNDNLESVQDSQEQEQEQEQEQQLSLFKDRSTSLLAVKDIYALSKKTFSCLLLRPDICAGPKIDRTIYRQNLKKYNLK